MTVIEAPSLVSIMLTVAVRSCLGSLKYHNMESRPFQNVVQHFSYVVANLIGLGAVFIIRSYHQNKPPGLQSLLSKVVILFTRTVDLVSWNGIITLSILEAAGELDFVPAAITVFVGQVLAIAFFMALLFLLVTKYLLVYHG